MRAVGRVESGKNLAWNVIVEPRASAIVADVTVTLRATTDCEANGAICAEDGRKLAHAVSVTVPGEVITPPDLSVAAARAEEAEGASLDFTVTLSKAATAEVTVDYATADGTGPGAAEAGLDYVGAAGTLTFAAGETERTIAVELLDDTDTEGVETLTLGLSNASGATLVDASAAGTIDDDETLRHLSVADAQVTEAEDAALAFTVTLSKASARDVTVDYATADDTTAVAATAGADYTAASGTLTFAAGETEKAITVDVLDDADAEGAETLTLTLSNPVGATLVDASAAGTIDDDEGKVRTDTGEVLTAEFADAPQSHGGETFTFRLAFSEDIPGLSWRTLREESLQASGGTVRNVSRVESGSNVAWTVTVEPDGSADVTIALPATTDCDAAGAICTEDRRPLSAAVEATVPNAPPQLSAADAQAQEAEGATLAFTVTLSQASVSEVTVDWASADDTATAGVDYTAASGTLAFAAGETEKTVTVDVLDDAVGEEAETLTLTLSNPSGATLERASATGTIEDDEALRHLSVADARAEEAEDATLAFTVTLSEASTTEVTVEYATADGTATAGADYTATSGTLTFEAGETSKTVSVPILEDAVEDDGETFTLTLANPSGGVYLADAQATATILDSEERTPLTAVFKDAPASHGGETFTFRLEFSEDVPGLGWQELREEALQASGGTVSNASRVQSGSNQAWNIGVEPDGTGDVTVTLPATSDCDATGAVCTSDGRMLSAAVTVTVPGEEETTTPVVEATPLTAHLSGVPAEHDGESALSFELRFSEAPSSLGFRTLRDSTLRITQGGSRLTPAVGRVERGSNEAWRVTVTPATKADITIAMTAPASCSEAGAICTQGGQALSLFGQEMTPEQRNEMEEALRTLTDAQGPTHTMSGRDVLLGTRFQLSAGADGEGGVGFTAWGEVATGGFEADVDATRLDGNVTTGFLGADVRADRWLAGLALSVSKGDGDYALVDGADRDDVESEMTAFYPYAQVGVTDTVDVWGLAGWGNGELTLTQHANANRAEARYTTDIAMRMGAVGVRGEVVSPDEAEGLRIAVKSDAFWVTTESDAVTSAHGRLGAAEGDASRVRLGVEAARRYETGGGAFTPTLEVGLRHDGGDAETGTGLEAGAALRYEGDGFSIEGSVRTLVAHEESGYEEWGASGAVRIDPGASGRGLSLTVAPSWGTGTGTGGLWSARDAAALAPEYEVDGERRVDAEVGYGLGFARLPGTVTPFAALSLADEYRTMRAGTRWALGYDASLELEGSRATGHAGEHDTTVMLRASVRF